MKTCTTIRYVSLFELTPTISAVGSFIVHADSTMGSRLDKETRGLLQRSTHKGSSAGDAMQMRWIIIGSEDQLGSSFWLSSWPPEEKGVNNVLEAPPECRIKCLGIERASIEGSMLR
jgi:hypothetical protein